MQIISWFLLLLLSHESRLKIIERVLKLLRDLSLFRDWLLFLGFAKHNFLVALACRVVLVSPQVFFEISSGHLLAKFEKCGADARELSVFDIFLLFGRSVSPVGFTKDVIKHFVQDHFVVLHLFVLLLKFDVHLAKRTEPLVDHKPTQNEILESLLDGVESLFSHLLFGVGLLRVVVHHVFIRVVVKRPKHLELSLEDDWHVDA